MRDNHAYTTFRNEEQPKYVIDTPMKIRLVCSGTPFKRQRELQHRDREVAPGDEHL